MKTKNCGFTRLNFKPKNFNGFTIVELLVVIVVIGILAAITIISYTGISQKASVSSLQSDLSSAKKQLALYYVDHGVYPTDITNNCPRDSVGVTDSKYCIKPSGSNAFTYNSSTPNSSFTLSNLNGSTRYFITNDTSPVLGSWIAGIAATALANKWVYNINLGIYQYKITQTAVVNPQGSTGLDPNHPSNMSLVSPQANPSVDFSEYTAQNSCKAIGGRLPNMNELLAIYAGRITTYGNNFPAGYYWSSTEYNSSSYAIAAGFYSGTTEFGGKSVNWYVRCVKD